MMAAPAESSGGSGAAAGRGGAEESEKHRQMQERFRAQQEARLQARQASRAQSEALKDPKESVGLFWAQLRATHDEVTRALDAVVQRHQEGQDGAGSGGGNGEAAQEALGPLSGKIEALEQRTTDAALFLPPYDVRRAQEEAQALRAKLEATRAALAPRKKFSFSARRKANAAAAVGGNAGVGEVQQQQQALKTTAPLQPPAPPTPRAPSVAGLSMAERPQQQEQEAAAAPAMEGFEGREGEELDLAAAYGADPPKDLLLKDLRRCTVRLLAPLSFLRLEGLRDCRVLCGPVAGPVYLEDCKGCTLFLASRQLRIHTTEACDLYVHTVSGPIIEDCNALRFAPYLLRYHGLDGHMTAAQLSRTQSAWREVKDFKWLRAQQSPHWAVLPEEERKEVEVAAVVAGGGDVDNEDEI